MVTASKKPEAIKNDKYTYEDYENWPDDERWELIDGEPYNMSPSPARKHQDIFGEIFNQFKTFLKGKTCKVYAAPFDVRLPKLGQSKKGTDTIVQPDISIICDRSKLDKKGCIGAPDLIVEILSPSTARKDMLEKRNIYQRHGVREYWIVDPDQEDINVLLLAADGKYDEPVTYKRGEKIKPSIFEDLEIDLGEVFQQE